MANEREIRAMLASVESLRGAGRLDDAEHACREILRGHPDHPETVHVLGFILGHLGKTDESLRTLRRAAELQPDSALVHHNLAIALRSSAEFEEAIAEFQRTIALDPNLAPAHVNLGITFKDLMRLDEAIACHRRAIRLKPDYADAHWNLALVLLRMGDFKNGLLEYEWRTKVRTLAPAPAFAEPRWTGEKFRGQTLLLFPEQGLGDAIQFARFIPMAAELGGSMVLASPRNLARIFERSFKMARVIPFGGKFPKFDLQCSLLSLPLVFGTDFTSIPAPIPYIGANLKLADFWAKKLPARDGRLRVGIAWAGNPNHQNDHQRSIEAKNLAALTEVNGISLFSLQKDKPPAEIPGLIDFTSDLADFSDTAALIENLDLVLSVDTSVAHLAGAMGKPTWLLVPFVPDWRWGGDRTETPWYPTMRLFRQDRGGDWAGVIRRVAAELEQYRQ